MAKIILDSEVFKALASSTRLSVLRCLDERRKTVTELARDLGLNKATVHEHLQLLVATGLVKKRDDEGRKWIYYELTWRGERLLHPQETTSFMVLLALSVAAAGGGIALLGRSLDLWWQEAQVSRGLPEGAPSQEDLRSDQISDDGPEVATSAVEDDAPRSEPPTEPSDSPEASDGGAGSEGEGEAADEDGNLTVEMDEPGPISNFSRQTSQDGAEAASSPDLLFDEDGWLGLALALSAALLAAAATTMRRLGRK